MMENLKFENNPYYSPEKCGLEIFESIDTAGSYEFDLFVIWKQLETGNLYWDTDSGCSCPSPFDNRDNGHDLKLITEDTFYNFDQALKNHYRISIDDYLKISKEVKDYLQDKSRLS